MNPSSALPRVIGPWMAGAIVVGCVIGSGVFKKAAPIARDVPESGMALLAWVFVGVLTLCGALALSEVAVLFPRAGGNYVFLREAYGRPAAFLWGWVEFWFIRAASNAAVATVFADAFHDLMKLVRGTNGEVVGYWERQHLSAAVMLALGLLNARGTRLGGGLQLVITTVKVGSLLALILLPVVVLAMVAEPITTPSVSRFNPVWPESLSGFNWTGFGAAMIAVMWAYNGWTNMAPIAGEVTNPSRNIPRALIGGILVLIVVYVGPNMAYYTTLSGTDLAAVKDTPVATEFCRRLLGPAGVMAASAAIMLSTFGSLSGTILVGPRGLFAMSADGLAPRQLAAVHSRFQTPAVAMMAVTVASVLLLYGGAAYAAVMSEVGKPPEPPFDLLTDFSIFGATVFETLAVATVFVFRRRLRSTERVYRCPGYPVVPAVYVVAMIAVLVNMLAGEKQQFQALVGLGFIVVGGAVYLAFFARRR